MAETIGKGILEVAFDPKQVEAAGKEQLLPSAKRLAVDFAAGFGAVKIAGFFKSGLDELKQAQAANAQVAAAIQSTGGAAGVTAQHVDDLAQSLLRMSGTDDEAIKGAESLLLQFSNIQNTGVDQTFDRATKAALDLAARMGTDVGSAAETLGRALQDPEQGMTRLQRAGVILTDQQKEQVKTFAETGRVAQAQGVILDQLEKQVGGSAAAFGQTLPGQVKLAQESIKNMQADMVGALAPALSFGAEKVTDLTEEIAKLPPVVQGTVGTLGLAAAGALALARPVRDAVALYDRFRGGATATAAATAELATAQNSAASVSGLYQEKTSGLAGAIGKAGLGAAVVATVFALEQYGESLNKTRISTEELDQVVHSSADTQVQYFLQLQRQSVAFGSGAFDDAINNLVRMGAAGVGTLQNLRAGFAAAGQDTSKFDSAIAAAQASQTSFNATTATGNAILGNNATASNTAAASTYNLADALSAVESERSKTLGSARSLLDAENSYAQAQRGVVDASRGVVQAQQSVRDAYRSVEDAERRLIDAQEALRKAQEPAGAEDLGKAQLDITDAQLRAADAAQALSDAQAEVVKDQKDGKHSAADVAEAQRKVQEAQNNVTRAIYAVKDAEAAYQKLQAKGTDQDEAVIAARRQVEDATRSVADAQDRVAQATQGVVDAQDRVNEAYANQATATANLKDAQDKLFTGESNVSNELYNQIKAFDAIRDKLAPDSPLRKNVEDYIGDLEAIRDVFSMSQEPQPIVRDPQARGPITPLPRIGFAGGGWATGTFRAAEKGWELGIMPTDGLYQAPPSGMQVLDHNTSARLLQSSSGIQWHGDVYVTNPIPEPASTSVARELGILADKLALIG